MVFAIRLYDCQIRLCISTLYYMFPILDDVFPSILPLDECFFALEAYGRSVFRATSLGLSVQTQGSPEARSRSPEKQKP